MRMPQRALALALAAACAAAGPVRAGEREQEKDPRPPYARFERKPEKLSAEEFRRRRAEVLRRCSLGAEVRDADAPWYFHYELGRIMAAAGDPQRALDAFIEAAMRKERSQKDARMYGMWFTDYYPYFQIARAHADLGNWSCAREALLLAEKQGEMAGKREELRELRDLVSAHEQPARRERPRE